MDAIKSNHADLLNALYEIVINQQEAELARVTAERDALCKDAERYRWLRDDDNWNDNGDAWQRLGELSHSEFDAAIDSARKEGGK